MAIIVHQPAMRLWDKKESLDYIDLRYLLQLADVGLKNELKQYYAAQAQRQPAASHIQAALRIFNQGS